MGLGRFVHHIGTFFVFAAMILLIVVDITSPVVNGISMLKVELGQNRAAASEVTFGTFGFCIRGIPGRGDECSSSRIGYNPARVIEGLDGTDFSTASADSAKVLTRVMVLHPIATGLAFIAFLLCAGSGIIGSFLSSIVSLLTFVVALVALICDFVGFSIIKRHVNDNDATASRAYWGAGIWLILVSGIFLLIGAAIVFVTCCFGRKKRDTERHKETWNDAPATGGRRRFW